jgi:hypothetical protein
MIETNYSPRGEANYNEYRKQSEKEINEKLIKKPEQNSIADIIIKLKVEVELLKESLTK